MLTVASPQAAQAEPWAVALNILWFSSLICSLASASIGILVKQWLHEYQIGISGSSPEIARLRQYRLNNLQKWRVGAIVAALPVLLQLSLSLFFAGLLVLLWNLHAAVAAVASILVGAVLTFVVVTTLLPAVLRDCCYLSPPTYVFYSITEPVRYATGSLFARVCWRLYKWCDGIGNGLDFSSLPGVLQNIIRRSEAWTLRIPLPHTQLLTWRGREQLVVQRSSDGLNADIVVTSYSNTMDLDHLANTAPATLMDRSRSVVVGCFHRIEVMNERHYGRLPPTMQSADFWAVVLMKATEEEFTRKTLSRTLIRKLYDTMPSSRAIPDLDAKSLGRLLLVLVTATTHLGDESISHYHALYLIGKTLSRYPVVTQQAVPWEIMQHGSSSFGQCHGLTAYSFYRSRRVSRSTAP